MEAVLYLRSKHHDLVSTTRHSVECFCTRWFESFHHCHDFLWLKDFSSGTWNPTSLGTIWKVEVAMRRYFCWIWRCSPFKARHLLKMKNFIYLLVVPELASFLTNCCPVIEELSVPNGWASTGVFDLLYLEEDKMFFFSFLALVSIWNYFTQLLFSFLFFFFLVWNSETKVSPSFTYEFKQTGILMKCHS